MSYFTLIKLSNHLTTRRYEQGLQTTIQCCKQLVNTKMELYDITSQLLEFVILDFATTHYYLLEFLTHWDTQISL